MNNGNKHVKPLTSPILIEQIDTILCRYNPAYGLIFQLMITTGIDLTQACHLTVGDLYKKKNVTFHGMRHHDITHTEPIPVFLQERLNAALKDKAPDEPAFTGAQGAQLHQQTFSHALRTVSRLVGCEQTIVGSTLHKTFIYNTFPKDKKKVYKFSGTKCPADIYKYLHIDPPDKEDEVHKLSAKEAFFSSEALTRTEEGFLSVIDEIKKATKDPTSVTDDYYRATMTFLNRVDSAISNLKKDLKE